MAESQAIKGKRHYCWGFMLCRVLRVTERILWLYCKNIETHRSFKPKCNKIRFASLKRSFWLFLGKIYWKEIRVWLCGKHFGDNQGVLERGDISFWTRLESASGDGEKLRTKKKIRSWNSLNLVVSWMCGVRELPKNGLQASCISNWVLQYLQYFEEENTERRS